jgi:hypothetical protein
MMRTIFTVRPAVAGLVHPSDPGWEQARAAWNLTVDQKPAAVALPASPEDVAAVVRHAAAHGLRVAAQGTGHSAAPMGPLDDTILLRTTRMRDVRIDPAARTARVEAGAVWEDVVVSAGRHGLAALAGSSPDVGVIGYTLGGGLSWLGRKHGLAANAVTAVELVTADARLVRADPVTEPDLFWALRGGGGSFGVVMALEMRLLPISEVTAGILWWPIERGAEILHAWRELTHGPPPDELTTVGRLLRFPPIPQVPEPVRGRSFVVVEAIHAGAPDEADVLLAPLRALGPSMDTVRRIPVPELARLHMDPEGPTPAVGDGLTLAELPSPAVEALVGAAGAETDVPLVSVEVRHLGGELGRSRPGSGALAAIGAQYALFAVGLGGDPAAARAVSRGVEEVTGALRPWAARHQYLNFSETAGDPRRLWSEGVYERLRRIKALVDPDDRIRANHPIPPAGA